MEGVIMKYNPNTHKNLKRMCNYFKVTVTNSKGQYDDVSNIQSRLKRVIGY